MQINNKLQTDWIQFLLKASISTFEGHLVPSHLLQYITWFILDQDWLQGWATWLSAFGICIKGKGCPMWAHIWLQYEAVGQISAVFHQGSQQRVHRNSYQDKPPCASVTVLGSNKPPRCILQANVFLIFYVSLSSWIAITTLRTPFLSPAVFHSLNPHPQILPLS